MFALQKGWSLRTVNESAGANRLSAFPAINHKHAQIRKSWRNVESNVTEFFRSFYRHAEEQPRAGRFKTTA